MTNFILKYSSVLFFVCILVCVTVIAGCSGPGETASEINVRHKYIMKSNMQQIQDDWDAVLLLDKPSKLSDKYQR